MSGSLVTQNAVTKQRGVQMLLELTTVAKIAQMIGLNQDERKSIAEKLMELGNLMFIGLVVAQLIPFTVNIRPTLAVVGVLAWVGLYTIALSILKGGGR